VAAAEVPAGTRVQVLQRLLEPHERAPGLPEDTAELPYEARVRGVLLEPTRPGEPATIRTAIGRTVTGRLEVVEPADTHSFGRPHPTLVEVAEEMRSLREELR
jgi:hypothetical protein